MYNGRIHLRTPKYGTGIRGSKKELYSSQVQPSPIAIKIYLNGNARFTIKNVNKK